MKRINQKLQQMHQYHFLFYLDGKQARGFRRQCIVPIDWQVEDAVRYLAQSLTDTVVEWTCLECTKVYLLNENLAKMSDQQATGIASYWVDAKGYSIELKHKQQEHLIYVLTDYATDEAGVQSQINAIVPDMHIRSDYYADCWLRSS
jgi:hypothetical protein